MVAAVGVQAGQSFVLSAAAGSASTVLGQAYVLAAGIYPAQDAQVGQTFVLAATGAAMTVQTSQAYVLVAAAGRVSDPRVRVWTFTLDGHDYWVLRCGNTETLIYDIHSQQWYTWGSGDSDLWRAYNGTNWPGGNLLAGGYGSNVVVGDDGNGAIYFLDPAGAVDDDPLVGNTTPREFIRKVQTQFPVHGRDATPCYAISLTGSIGNLVNSSFATVNLYTSDDRGNSYTDCGTVTISDTDYTARVEWRSLGQMKAPGRLFKVTDYGSLQRIDSIDLVDGK